MMQGLRFLALVFLAAWSLAGVAQTLEPRQFEIASQDGKLRIPAWWFESGDKEPRPVVIGLHGCGGALDSKGKLADRMTRYAGYFNAEGLHFLAIESFAARDQKSICEIPNSKRTIHESDRREDVFAAIKWLARQPSVDASRIVVLGWSHGAQTTLSVMDATDKFVQTQTIKPKAAVAFYPGCSAFTRMVSYEVHAPLLMMVGELDDWTPARYCVSLHERLRKNSVNAPVDLVVYPGSYHGFDGTGTVAVRDNVGNSKSGKATVGGNPEAREASHARLFDFLSAQVGEPLRLTHAQRFKGHHYRVPSASGFAAADDAAAVPVSEAGKPRYSHFRTLPSPKAFVVTEKGGWYFHAGEPEAMAMAFRSCARAGVKCWLYAVDDQVVWQSDVAARAGAQSLQRVGAAAAR